MLMMIKLALITMISHIHCSQMTTSPPMRTVINSILLHPRYYPAGIINYTAGMEVQWKPSHRLKNKKVKIVNGNIKNTLKVTHCNIGNKFWVRKVTEIQNILQTRQSDILFVSEANIFKSDLDHEICIPGYQIITTKSMDTYGNSRLVALVKDGIQIEHQEQWMNDKVASIWFKYASKGTKKLHLGGVYREHSLLKKNLPTNSEALQTARWTQFVNQWLLASKSANCTVIGDTNLDHLKWTQPEQINKKMTNMVNNNFETTGFYQIITGATRFWPHKNDSLVDQCWTNCPEKISSNLNLPNGTADHNLIEISIQDKGKIGVAK